MKLKPFLSCEHADNGVPNRYLYLFEGAEIELVSHRGYDLGASVLYDTLKKHLHCPGRFQKITRLLVECNRSVHHKDLFSPYSKKLPPRKKQEIVDAYYHPYRNSVERGIARLMQKGDTVLHLSLHTFTPVLNGQKRSTDIGLLYDPSRGREKLFCAKLKATLRQQLPALRVRCNYPYRGTADGFTTYLRKKLPAARYLGIELEIKQEIWVKDPLGWREVQLGVATALKQVLA